jgi:hypothetical protein
MPSTTLPAPEIEIGSRLPDGRSMHGIPSGSCEPVHISQSKWRQSRESRAAGLTGLMGDVTTAAGSLF